MNENNSKNLANALIADYSNKSIFERIENSKSLQWKNSKAFWEKIGNYLGCNWSESEKHEKDIIEWRNMYLGRDEIKEDWEFDRLVYFALNDSQSNTYKLIKGQDDGVFSKNGIDVEWVDIPAGTFMMGSPKTEMERGVNEGPQHQVTLSGFKMSKFAVTFAQYDAFCEATGRSKPSDEGMGRGKRPVINVDWNDATAFAQWMGCRLPTEAEWEYACRAGTSTPFNTGDCLSTAQANYDGNEPYSNCIKGSYLERTQPVGSYAPNAWGLYDMHGNVWEWCSDWRGSYSSFPQTNPTGPASGSNRVLRGGGWYYNGGSCRSARRGGNGPSNPDDSAGFRLVVPS